MYWWELDLSYLVLRGLERLGLVWDLKVYPEKIYEEARLQPLEVDPSS
jgi:stearoyl-CoA desaturase (delta-9 desaturase)